MNKVLFGDCRDSMRQMIADGIKAQMCVTSPPYFGLRDYGHPGQLGLESTPAEFIANLVEVFRLVRELLADDGVLFLNIGDSYSGSQMTGGNKGFNKSGGSDGFKQKRQFKKPLSVQHADLCGTSGKVPVGSQDRDCLCGSLCDACRRAYRIGKSHSGCQPVPTPSLSPCATIREHTESQTDHLPTLDSLNLENHNASAIPDPVNTEVHAIELLHAERESTTPLSSRQHETECLAVESLDALCQLCGCSLPDCVQEFVDKTACTCGIESPLNPSSQGKKDKFYSDSAYLHSTTKHLKPKDLIGIPWMLAFALRADGWYLRQDIIWAKPNPMPESVQGSHYSRHRVTIAEYEKLSGLQYTDERSGDDWAGDMPCLSEREKVSGKAPLSAKPQGQGNSQSEGITRGRARKAEGVQPVAAGLGQQGAAREDGEGYQDAQRGCCSVQGNAKSESNGSTLPSAHKNESRPHRAEIACSIQLHQESEGESPVEENVCAAQGRDTFDGKPIDSGGLGIDFRSQSGLVSLLWDASKTDDGSCNALEQGRATHERECGSGLPAVQLQETRQDTSTDLVGCPGCPKCIQHHGYIFHLSAGRCTKSHEYIFLLSKSEKYFYNHEAIKERAAPASLARLAQDVENQAGSDRVPGKTNGNMKAVGGRSKRDSFKRDDSKRAEVIPGQTVGTHRPDRNESEYDTETRNKRSVWTVATTPYKGAHFATYPPELIEPCIMAGSRPGDIVLDPFFGSGTTGQVCESLGRQWIGCELNQDYEVLQKARTAQQGMVFG